jgi:hypothetical protein
MPSEHKNSFCLIPRSRSVHRCVRWSLRLFHKNEIRKNVEYYAERPLRRGEVRKQVFLMYQAAELIFFLVAVACVLCLSSGVVTCGAPYIHSSCGVMLRAKNKASLPPAQLSFTLVFPGKSLNNRLHVSVASHLLQLTTP